MDLSRYWPIDGGDGLRRQLETAYADPARGYHDLRHLSEVFVRLDELAAAGESFEETPVLLAAWFHDAVYDGAAGAEARSATWAQEALSAAALDEGTVAEVVRLVLMTEQHRPDDGDRNGTVLSDADLAILAADEERYAEYTRDVRHEYSFLDESDFRRGRAAVLESLAGTGSLFRTHHGRAHWEQPARENIRRELAELRA